MTVARGLTNAEIARALHISLSTVRTHLATLMRKLDARNRVEIAMWGLRDGARRRRRRRLKRGVIGRKYEGSVRPTSDPKAYFGAMLNEIVSRHDRAHDYDIEASFVVRRAP